MRADKIVELAVKSVPQARDAGVNALSVPVFEFGRFDYPDFKGIQEDSILCWNEGLMEFPFDEFCFVHNYDLIDDARMLDNWSLYHIARGSHGGIDVVEWRSFNPGGRGQVGMPPMMTLTVIPDRTRPIQWATIWSLTKWVPAEMAGPIIERMNGDGGLIAESMDPVMAMLMYLNTRGVISERIPAATELNKSRLKKGKLPIPERHLVRIDPRVLGACGGSGDGHHASPRPHYRRGHVRRLDEGRTTWVKACIVAGSIQDACVPTYEVRK